MLFYVLKRLAYLAAILFVMSVLVFLITQALPGDVAHLIAGQFATDEVVAAVADRLLAWGVADLCLHRVSGLPNRVPSARRMPAPSAPVCGDEWQA